jgi:hypothetical protein
LVAEPLRWTNEIRALAQDIGNGDIWLEKVIVETAPAADGQRAQASEGPVGELLARVAEIKANPQRLAALPGEFAELWEKLPAELREGPDALGLHDPQQLAGLLEEVQQLLIHRLLDREGRA